MLAHKSEVPPLYVKNVTPLTIGMVAKRDNVLVCLPVIRRNTPFPTKRIFTGTTVRNGQTSGGMVLVEGEHSLLEDNTIIGSTVLNGLIPTNKGNETIDISLKIDDKGCILFSAVDRRTKNSTAIRIQKDFPFSVDRILQMKQVLDQIPKAIGKPADNALDEDIFDLTNVLNRANKRRKLEIIDEVCPVYGGSSGPHHGTEMNQVELDE